MSRGREMRAQRRAAQFAKFRMTELNLVPLVDTMVAIVFFALVTQTVGEMTQIVPGVTLPDSRVGMVTHEQLTLGITRTSVTLGGRTIMGTGQAAAAQSNIAKEPLVIPQLYQVLKAKADSIKAATNMRDSASIPTKLAIQGDREVRYSLMSRIIVSARYAGFRNVTLQVNKTGDEQQTAGR